MGEQPLLPYEACLTGDTLVYTPSGVRRLDYLSSGIDNEDNYVFSNDNKLHRYNKCISKGIKSVYKITFKNKLTIKATADHRFELDNKNLLPVSSLCPGMRCKFQKKIPCPIFDEFDPMFEMFGWLHGDGMYTENGIGISFNYKDGDIDAKNRLLPIFLDVFNGRQVKPSRDDEISYDLTLYNSQYVEELTTKYGFVKAGAFEKVLPLKFMEWELNQQLSFIRGLFEADGSVCGKSNAQIMLASTSYVLLEQVQKFLTTLGIHGSIYTTKFSENINRRDQHRLIITKRSADKIARLIGFSTNVKNIKINKSRYSDEDSLEIISIEYSGEEEVFDIVEVDSTNMFYANGISVHNCNLGSINLVNMLRPLSVSIDPDTSVVTYAPMILNEDKLRDTVKKAVHFLDNVIDVNVYPLSKIDEMTKKSRRIGLGVMGFSDMLLKMGIPYNTDRARVIAEKIMKIINDTGWEASEELAKVRGTFPVYEDASVSVPARNATITTIAPTGTLSIIANCSSGIEPVFAFAYIRNIMDNTEMVEFNPILKEVLISRGLYTDELAKKIAKEGTLQHIDEIPDDIKRVFVCAHDISYSDHVLMQASVQKYVDNAVSKTINFNNDATKEDIANAYMMAYDSGCKGITVYRDGCRQFQVLNIGSVKGKEEKKEDIIEEKTPIEVAPRKRGDVLTGITEKVKIGCGNLYVTVNYDEEGICEVFTSTGKSGGCPSQSEATARLTSIALRSGISIDEIVSQLRGIRCPSTIRRADMKCTSCPDAIARTILKVKERIEKDPNIKISMDDILTQKSETAKSSIDDTHESVDRCPECNAPLEHEGGCNICRNCGYSKCN